MKKEIISCYINSLTNINGVQLCFGNLKNEKTLHLAPKNANSQQYACSWHATSANTRTVLKP